MCVDCTYISVKSIHITYIPADTRLLTRLKNTTRWKERGNWDDQEDQGKYLYIYMYIHKMLYVDAYMEDITILFTWTFCSFSLSAYVLVLLYYCRDERPVFLQLKSSDSQKIYFCIFGHSLTLWNILNYVSNLCFVSGFFPGIIILHKTKY